MSPDPDPLVSQPASGLVLVVDDEPRNRALLRELLEGEGHEVAEAANGPTGLTTATELLPDAILLDAMMPLLDGFEVCRRLKSSSTTAAIPVIMVTSLSERGERLRGIRAGATDFITKPIDTADLLLRVRNAVTTKRLYDQMARQYVRLRELEALRDSLVHMVVHDLRSPLGALSALLELLVIDLAGTHLESAELATEAQEHARRIAEMINAVLDVSRFEAGSMPLSLEAVELGGIVAEAVAHLGRIARRRIAVNEAGQEVWIRCDRQLIRRVLLNLLGNALKFSDDDRGVTVLLLPELHAVRVEVADRGPGIPEDQLGVVFEKFGQAVGPRRAAHGSGLGLTFCKLAVEAHHGSIGVRSSLGEGSTFWFTLPAGGPPRISAPASVPVA